MWTDDPVRDAAAHDAEGEAWLKSLPVCDECGEPIVEDFYWEINGDVYCEDCLQKHIKWIR